MQNSILSRHYKNYLEMLANNNNKLVSTNLTDLQIQNLYNKKYNLTEFEIYKYLTVLDFISDSLGCSRYKLIEGITLEKNMYNNILIDLFYYNIHDHLTIGAPISIVFGIKKVGQEIQDLTASDKINPEFFKTFINDLNYIDPDTGEHRTLDYKEIWYNENSSYKAGFSNYAGNSFTYYIFKQLIKLFLTEVYLYQFKGNVFTHKELESEYISTLYDGELEYFGEHNDDWDYKTSLAYYGGDLKIGQIKYKNKDPDPIPETIPMSQWMIENKITKVKYQCIKVMDPHNIYSDTISELKLYLIDISKFRDFNEMCESLIQKEFNSFWDCELWSLNFDFTEDLNNLNKKRLSYKSLDITNSLNELYNKIL